MLVGSGGNDGQACEPGRVVECPCPDDMGWQECAADGSGFDACACPDGSGGIQETGGGPAVGGEATGGEESSGGSTGGPQETGGDSSTGGESSGGVSSGGSSGGSESTGGAPSGGAPADGGSPQTGGDMGTGGSDPCEWEYFEDLDGDGFGNPDVGSCDPMPLWVTDDTDCYDGNSLAHPGDPEPLLVTHYYEEDRGDGSWDYNCDGEEVVFWTDLRDDCAPGVAGWVDETIPECGVEAYWGTSNCAGGLWQIQKCR